MALDAEIAIGLNDGWPPVCCTDDSVEDVALRGPAIGRERFEIGCRH